MGFLDKAKRIARKNSGTIEKVVDKAGDVVDQKTQGKYADKVDKAQKAVKDQTRKL
ncbi:MAG: antitoxin [Aeromicrobium erythreum]